MCLRLRDYPDNTGALDISNFSDKKAELDNGKIISAPELERRIDMFLKYYDGFWVCLF